MSASPDGMIPRTPPTVDHVDYSGEGLADGEVPGAPFALVTSWIDTARARQADRGDVPEPLSFAVATVDADGRPDVRTVLMRFLDARGPGFVTNLESAKSRQLQATPGIAATITWPAMFRAVRFRGQAELVAEAEIDRYFAERPRGSQLSAWVSHQSQPIEGREPLERADRTHGVRERDLHPGVLGRGVLRRREDLVEGAPDPGERPEHGCLDRLDPDRAVGVEVEEQRALGVRGLAE